jgi:hypothetical protein
LFRLWARQPHIGYSWRWLTEYFPVGEVYSTDSREGKADTMEQAKEAAIDAIKEINPAHEW